MREKEKEGKKTKQKQKQTRSKMDVWLLLSYGKRGRKGSEREQNFFHSGSSSVKHFCPPPNVVLIQISFTFPATNTKSSLKCKHFTQYSHCETNQ